MTFNEQLRPLTQLLRRRRKELKLTSEEVSTLAGNGCTWTTALETGKGTNNPSVGVLARWCETLGAQEFGVYVVIDGHHTAVPVFETEDQDITDDEDSA